MTLSSSASASASASASFIFASAAAAASASVLAEAAAAGAAAGASSPAASASAAAAASLSRAPSPDDSDSNYSGSVGGGVFNATYRRVVVTDQAMGARCVVAADFDGDGRNDLVSASSNDNAVSWYRNEGPADGGADEGGGGLPAFSIKRKITWQSLGSRIVTVADVDGDGDVDVVGASYYDSTLRWFENDGSGNFASHIISSAVDEGQGVTVADLDNDGDVDVATASSGDNTIAVFKNIDRGTFCEIKEVVDSDAIGARTVVAADLNGDGWIDLASASKDDDSVAWYPNDGAGHFPTKILISRGELSDGAYSLVAVDIDKDGDEDLVVASNGNDCVTLWRNDGNGNFTRTLIYDNADFVLSVTAVDFDRDGDIDVASASFFDGRINWYENVDGEGYEWRQHTIYAGIQGHYVSHADMDGDGDDDLLAVDHAENAVMVFAARTDCDLEDAGVECCRQGTEWNGTMCDPCPAGTYGGGGGLSAKCVDCPKYACTVPGYKVMPATCAVVTGCADAESSLAECSCPADSVKDSGTDACTACPGGQIRPDSRFGRDMDTLGNYTKWELRQGVCSVIEVKDYTPLIYSLVAVAALSLLALAYVWRKHAALKRADKAWIIKEEEIYYDDPPERLGRGTFGQVIKGYYRGTAVAIKGTRPIEEVRAGPTGGNNSILLKSIGNGSDPTAASSFDDKRIGSYRIHGSDRTLRSSMGSLMGSVRSVSSVRSFSDLPLGLPLSATDLASGRASVSEGSLRQSFKVEMRTLARLRHPCITTVMGAVRPTSKSPRLVMEYMERGSLRDLLSNKTFPLDPELTLPLIRDILQGMRFLHAANPPIVHGDLKCANVLVDGNFRAKIADFGLSARCKPGTIQGTPFWMAPELLDGRGAKSTKSDVYAFGVTLWEVMTHKIPYNDLDMSFGDIIDGVRRGELRPDCSGNLLEEELVECMQGCWAQNPADRPSLEELELRLIPLCGQNLFTVMQERSKHARKQNTLIRDVFPQHVADDLLAGKKVQPQHHDCVTIYFSDIVGFTTVSSQLTAAEVSDLLDRLYTKFDALAERHGVFKLETIGDAWVGATNLVKRQAEDHAARIAKFAVDTVRAAQSTPIHSSRPEWGNVRIRAGFHSGPVVASVVGTKNPRYCLFGDTMNTASRMESTSKELRVQCSARAADLAMKQGGDDNTLKFVHRGKINVKGKGSMHTYWIDYDGDVGEESRLQDLEDLLSREEVSNGDGCA